eukprot:4459658-Pyramimonas_sp.AAC.1
MGAVVAHLLELPQGRAPEGNLQGDLEAVWKDWTAEIEARSDPALPHSMREAVGGAVLASRVLALTPPEEGRGRSGQAGESGASVEAAARTWLVALRLMEDEDPEIRAVAATAASKAMAWQGAAEATAGQPAQV